LEAAIAIKFLVVLSIACLFIADFCRSLRRQSHACAYRSLYFGSSSPFLRLIDVLSRLGRGIFPAIMFPWHEGQVWPFALGIGVNSYATPRPAKRAQPKLKDDNEPIRPFCEERLTQPN
jgi:hypothetical protein